MAYDEKLAGAIRRTIGAHPGLTEKKMFGGLAFLINGNMSVAASGEGGLLVRCDPGQSDDLIKRGAEPMVMRGREMKGWLRVKEISEITKWVEIGVGYASSLPPK